MKKKELSQEEQAAKDAAATHNRRVAGFVRTLKAQCSENGLRSVELQLEHLQKQHGVELPKSYFDKQQTIACFNRAIDEYKQSVPVQEQMPGQLSII